MVDDFFDVSGSDLFDFSAEFAHFEIEGVLHFPVFFFPAEVTQGDGQAIGIVR